MRPYARRAGATAALLILALPLWAQTARRAVIIDIDGIRRDTFEQAYHERRLPSFERIFARALWFDNATTVLPTVTMAAQASIFTGVAPARHGVPGNQWYDRETHRLVDYMSVEGVACVYGVTLFGGAACAGGMANNHLLAPTLYEAAAAAGLATGVIYSQYWRGASHPAPPGILEALGFIKDNYVDYRAFDRAMAARAVTELKARGLPAILTLYFAGADGIAHSEGIASQPPYLSDSIDPMLGSVLDAIESFDPAWHENTLFVLASDHGRSDAVLHPEDLFLLADLKAALPSGAEVAENGGIAYIYYDVPADDLARLAAALAADSRLSAAVDSVRLRGPDDPARAGDLVVALRQGHYFGNNGTGSHHGSIFDPDRAVPLLLAGPGIGPGHVRRAVSNTQIARTIAGCLGFAMDTADPALPALNTVPAGRLRPPLRR